MNKTQLEEKAAALGYSFEQGAKKGAGYNLIADDGDMPLGHDHTASLSDIAKFLDGLDVDPDEEVEVEVVDEEGGTSNPKPKSAKVQGPTPQQIAASLRGHENADQIKDAMKATTEYSKQDDHNVKALDHLMSIVSNSRSADALRKRPKAEQDKVRRNLNAALDAAQAASDAKIPKKPLPIREYGLDWDHSLSQERARQSRVFNKANERLKTNQHTRFDRPDNGLDVWYRDDVNVAAPDPAKLHKKRIDEADKSFIAPDQSTPDFAAPKAAAGFIASKVQRRIPKAEMQQLRIASAIRAAIAKGDRAEAGRLLREAKAAIGHGDFLVWTAKQAFSVTDRTLQIWMSE